MAVRKLRRASLGRSSHLSLYYCCLSVMFAYVMLISPIGLQDLPEAGSLYTYLDTTHWGETGTIVEYGHWEGEVDPVFVPGYDANGSVIEKLTWDTSGAEAVLIEEVHYEYNLQNRLEPILKTPERPIYSKAKMPLKGFRYEETKDNKQI